MQTSHGSNWHPVVWLSHMMDCSFFGLFPGGHHLTNLLLHVLDTVLLFLLLRRMTGAVWRSALVAALFGWHPLHVESVAWVAERKNVLSTLFWILTVWAYARYVATPNPRRFALTLLLFALGLMTKPMLVTLPFVLLLLDFWPLGRLRTAPETELEPGQPIKNAARTWWKLLWEKWPFFVLSVASAAVTIWAQQRGGALKSLEATPLAVRLVNATAAYGAYLWKMVWPAQRWSLAPWSRAVNSVIGRMARRSLNTLSALPSATTSPTITSAPLSPRKAAAPRRWRSSGKRCGSNPIMRRPISTWPPIWRR